MNTLSTAKAIAIIEAESLSHLLSRKASYLELGSDYFDCHNIEVHRRQLIHRLEALGVKVTIEVPACGGIAPLPNIS